MPKGYWVTTYRTINDPAKVAAYAALAGPVMAEFGCRYLCRGPAAVAHEAGVKERVVVGEFPSLEAAIACHDSPGYQKALDVLADGAVRDMRFVEGVE
ncbi:DUF1330 domain-containing protein [Rhodoplanes sp. TEM]|uniref:DUF1330 domain-containing protein n=1 Tax=Rhodoplanes tepidamans TaxID=200616 RepID=A0ABT5J9J9_RHOTP|nr:MULTISPECIES: DUF1330 domain-containing protein [Rhodoplanes]MDC7786157.1 DUF1330 domain-containing protein [Rhodoplanes tepidamans]MDC7982824.1 DUF1330 domain-containing protein [Rhodoplanes sp. TEM]MDQ0357178.1 uncharacterized protein (DUF1330 family) [Rhodoplanes tepidamans]